MLRHDPHCRLNPDEVVALGAAVQAGLIARDAAVSDMVVTDVAPYTLGISISKQFGQSHREGYFLPIIHRNTTIPVSRVERVGTVNPNQTTIVVKVYQGESRRVEQNLLLGQFEVQGIPAGPAGREVDIRFTYDLNGVLEVEATVVETGKLINHVITRLSRNLTDKDIARAVAEMQHLKTHAREETANRYTLRRAERIYQELPARERDVLGQMLDGFETALDGGDKTVIERHREAIDEFLDRFDLGYRQDPDSPDDSDEPEVGGSGTRDDD